MDTGGLHRFVGYAPDDPHSYPGLVDIERLAEAFTDEMNGLQSAVMKLMRKARAVPDHAWPTARPAFETSFESACAGIREAVEPRPAIGWRTTPISPARGHLSLITA
jgi:hypothetical protein